MATKEYNHRVHVAREIMERLYGTLSSCQAQVAKEWSQAKIDLSGTLEYEDWTFVSDMLVQVRMLISENSKMMKVYEELLAKWPIPEMPPLDFTNIPDVVFYKGGNE